MEILVQSFENVDWSVVHWRELWSFEQFQWTIGKTPFSHLQVPLFVIAVYLLSIFSIQIYMKERKPFSLKWITFVHNVALTMLSVVMFFGAFYGAYRKYQSQGFWAGLVCEQHQEPIRGSLFYWCYIFYLSKFYELLDSFLLVLKKKPLIFLHVFHHLIMPFVCWAGLEGKWCMALWTSCFWNSFVHIFMYFYYAVSTLGYNPSWKKHLTALQIFQFLSGVVYTAIYFYYYIRSIAFTFDGYIPKVTIEQGCTGDLRAILFMFSVNCSFLLLFGKFFHDSYSHKSGFNMKKPKSSDSSNSNIINGATCDVKKHN